MGKTADGRTRISFTLNQENVEWLADWLKRNNAPRVMLSQMVEEYLQGVRFTLEELEKTRTTPTIGDLFRISGDALNRLKEPPLL
jgi:DNA-binding PadR family transcriptional regulator